MLTAGDEFGRRQGGNNNAYAQDNPLTWLDWEGRDRGLEDHVAALAALRRAHPALSEPAFLNGAPGPDDVPDVAWLTAAGAAKTVADWQSAPSAALAMVLGRGGGAIDDGRLAVLFNRSGHEIVFHLPARDGHHWEAQGGIVAVAPRSVAFVAEKPGSAALTSAPAQATIPLNRSGRGT